MSLLRCLTWALALAACDAEATAPPAPAAVMLDQWQHATPARSGNRPSLNMGLQVTLTIDFADGAVFGGHVVVQQFPKFPNAVINLYETIPHGHKLLFRADCAGHYLVWERQRRVLHHTSKEWLKHGAVDEQTTGIFSVDTEGVIHPE